MGLFDSVKKVVDSAVKSVKYKQNFLLLKSLLKPSSKLYS